MTDRVKIDTKAALDEIHLEMTNQLIAFLNHLLELGYGSEVVSSAAVAGAAAFANFNLGGAKMTDADARRVADQFHGRLLDSRRNARGAS